METYCRFACRKHGEVLDLSQGKLALSTYTIICNSYTMPTRAVWDLSPEPDGEGYKSHTARGGVV